MEIQNISGADEVPTGFSVKSVIPNESVNLENDRSASNERIPEENKGRQIDTYA